MSAARPHKISQTARYMALFRALETARQRDRLVEDKFAIRFLPATWRATIWAAGIFRMTRLVEREIDKHGIGAWSSGRGAHAAHR